MRVRTYARTFVALWYVLGWLSHVYLALFAPGTYAVFGATAIIPGFAHLWGTAPTDMVRQAYRAAAENVPGVRTVEVHMHIVPPPAIQVGL